MDLRGEEDVTGWSSLPAVEQDTARHLLRRAAPRTESNVVCLQEKPLIANAVHSQIISFF